LCSADGINTTVAFEDESGGTRISDCYFDNANLKLSGFRGTTVVNSFFNGGARLEIAKPASVRGKISPTNLECQYWDGAVCKLVVTGNQMLCAKAGCATINTTYAIPAASNVFVHSNAFEGVNSSVCSLKSKCTGEEDCKSLFGPCSSALNDRHTLA
jgi:hypothetical protein